VLRRFGSEAYQRTSGLKREGHTVTGPHG
jgi:hypothetical protein